MSTINNWSQLTLSDTHTLASGASSTYKKVVYVGGTRTGVPVKNWKSIIANGGNATSKFSAQSIENVGLLPMAGKATNKTAPQSWATNSGTTQLEYAPLVIDGSVLSTCDNLARAKALSDVRSGFNGSTFLGELAQVISMVRNPALELRKRALSQAQLHKRYRSAARTVNAYRKAIAGSWLEFQFGWVPLASDIYNAVDAYNRLSQKKESISFKGTYKQTVSTPRTLVSSSTWGHPFIFYKYMSTRTTYSVSYQGRAFIKAGIPRQSFHFGTTMPDFIPTAWELLPWSFLIDYFTNVGDIINTSAVLQLFNFSYISKTSRVLQRQNVDTLVDTLIPSVYNMSNTKAGNATWLLKDVKRPDNTTLQTPSLELSRKLNLKQGLNILALLNARDLDRNWRR